MKHIREKLDHESQRVQSLLFLKQLEHERSAEVVWEQTTLQMMRDIEEEKHRLNNTDYEKALKPRKPRPRDLMEGKVSLYGNLMMSESRS